MTALPLRLGPLTAHGHAVRRSGIRWLYSDGHMCRPGKIIAYCNIGLARNPETRGRTPFADEMRDLQVAFAPRLGGQLRIAPDSSRGGALDQLHYWLNWTSDFVIGHIECEPPVSGGETGMRLLLLAGQRMADNTESHAGLLTGWLQRSRGWWAGRGDIFGTVLSLGICELVGIIRGDRWAFTELFETIPGPAQIVHFPDNSLVPCAPVVSEQFLRTAAEAEAIARDFAQTFTTGAIVPTASNWLFAGSLLGALQLSPLTQRFDVLTRKGLEVIGPADAVILSLNSESQFLLRHRRLGYTLNCHPFRVQNAGPAVRAWLRANFEPVRRTTDDVFRDYCRLIDAVSQRLRTQFLIVNSISTAAAEDIHCYQSFERPLGSTLATVRARELNLMLHDLQKVRDVSIVDLDAIAADFGNAFHLPDGIHPSGPLQTELRDEIVRILHARGIPGFGHTGSGHVELHE